MNDLVKANYHDLSVSFTEDGWFNATAVAERFGKTPFEWLRLSSTKEYVEALERRYGKIPYVKSSRARADRGGGTWLHPKLAIRFAQWLDIDFAVWCDEQIEGLLKGNHPHYDWKRLRHEATSSHKVKNEALRLVREAQGKMTSPHHYMNECRLINSVLAGRFKGIDRDTLSHDDLTLLARLEVKDAVLLGLGFSFQERQTALRVHAVELRQPRNPALSVQPPLVKVFHDSHHGASALQ